MTKPMRRLGRTCLVLLVAATLAACAGAVAPTPPIAGGGFGNLSAMDSAAFGRRATTPGFTVDRGFSGSGA